MDFCLALILSQQSNDPFFEKGVMYLTVLMFEMDAMNLNAFGDRTNLPPKPRHGFVNYVFTSGHARNIGNNYVAW